MGKAVISCSILSVFCILTSCQHSDMTYRNVFPEPLYSFEKNNNEQGISFINAQGKTTDRYATHGKQALNIQYSSQQHSYASVNFQPKKPWDWSQYKNFSIAFDIGNQGKFSSHLYLDIEDIDGNIYTRSVNVAVGSEHTYYAKMHGHDLSNDKNDLNLSSGLRSNPPTWQSKDITFISMWGKKNLNIEGITRISLSVQSNLHDKEIVIDNIRLIENPTQDKHYLTNIVDQFGQNAKIDFDGKIHSKKELLQYRDRELALLREKTLFTERSKFSGWKNGPKLKASGYFRTEKINGKWSLVDPEGYLYFATGIDIIRLSNSSTMTGYDFDNSLIQQRSDDDITPEDSTGLNRVSEKVLSTRKNIASIRTNMFEWLPAYNSPLGNHFGYRRSAHSGPLKQGETFSFYSANLERKYGETSPQSYLKDWKRVTIDRMLHWGFTSLGNWTDPMYYHENKIPYFANGWIIGDFKTVSSGNDFWSPMPDVFDPAFKKRAIATAKKVAEEVKGNPWCVGVFIDNEKSFGRPETNESRYGIVLHTLRRDGKTVPTKSEFTRLMKKKYSTISAINSAWKKSFKNWQEFDKGIDSSINTKPQLTDYSLLLKAYAEQYFKIVNEAIKSYMPNHLYFGARFPDWGMPMEVIEASAKHVDVISYNSYKEGLPQYKWDFLKKIDKPSIIGEFHIGAADSGLYHPGLIHAADQKDRARMYTDYMYSVIDNPYFVGAHWFQYIDSPITGRAYDGENYNVGFVSVADIPYTEMVNAAKSLHSNMYKRRFSELPELLSSKKNN